MSTCATRFALSAALALIVSNPVRAVDDCNSNGVPDAEDITNGVSADMDGNGVPDECELCPAVDTDELSAAPQSSGDRFGFAVATSGEFVAVGAPRDDSAAFDAGLVVVYRMTYGEPLFDGTLMASDAAGLDHYGQAVAMDGDVIAVGAPDEDDGGLSAGAVYVYRFDGGSTWVEEAKLTAGDASAGAHFGASVCVRGDTIWVGASGADKGAGAVYVFDFMANDWEEMARLSPSDADAGDAFGTSLASDGVRVFVGAPLDDAGGSNAGAAYVFSREKAWTEDAKLMASDSQVGDRFGASVATSGTDVFVGAPDGDAGSANGGAVYVFAASGASWAEVEKLVRYDSDPGDRFGEALAASSEMVAVASPGDDGDGYDAGVVHAYCRVASVWRPVAMLLPAAGHLGDSFGTAVAVSGPTAVVGAWQNDGAGSSAGTAYVFSGAADCDANGRLDICELQDGTADDVNANGVPDTCDPDCNENGVPDDLDLADGTEADCNGNGVPDSCDIADGVASDCNGNGVPDSCDFADGVESDCNGNGVPDSCDIADGVDSDCNGNGVPDDCEGGADEVCRGDADTDGDGVPDGEDWCPQTEPGQSVDEHGCARGDQALVCHVPPGNPDARHEIWVSPQAVPAHLRHGDSIGPCDGEAVADFSGTVDDGGQKPGGPTTPDVPQALLNETCAAGAAGAVPLTALGLVGIRRRRAWRRR